MIVVRTSPTEIKAYQNSCRHRGMQLAVRDAARSAAGRSSARSTPGATTSTAPLDPSYGCEGFDERVLDPEDVRLVECQVGTWAGCAFINMDLGAPPLMEALHPVPELLEPLQRR